MSISAREPIDLKSILDTLDAAGIDSLDGYDNAEASSRNAELVDYVSDCSHTFRGLYEHRDLLFLAFTRAYHDISAWKSRLHSDGSSYEGYFICGVSIWIEGVYTPITYYLSEQHWNLARHHQELEHAPEWDGSTSSDVLERLTKWLEQM